VLLSNWTEAKLLQLEADAGRLVAREVWKSARLKGSYSPTVFHDGHLLVTHGPYLTCVDPASGEPRWREKVYTGSLILVDGHALLPAGSSGDSRIRPATPPRQRETD